MVETSATELVRDFSSYLARVEHGESVLIRKHGRAVARLVPASGFMDGKEFSRVFESYKADALDKAAAEAIGKAVGELDREVDDALAH